MIQNFLRKKFLNFPFPREKVKRFHVIFFDSSFVFDRMEPFARSPVLDFGVHFVRIHSAFGGMLQILREF